MKQMKKYMCGIGTAVAAVFALSACGGGGGSAGVTSAPVVSTGTMTKGSVIVNGVRFTAGAGAAIRVDDNPNSTEAELRDGMEVKVKGRINDDRITGQFEKVEAEPRVRGQMRHARVLFLEHDREDCPRRVNRCGGKYVIDRVEGGEENKTRIRR